jgi:hypothetical protein
MQDVTRRWVLRLGGVLLGGFSGIETNGADLPPGLYLPSIDHLAHRLHAVAAGRPAAYEPAFFTTEEFGLLQRIIGVLLGDVEDASAVITEIATWIDLVVSESAAVRAAASALAPGHRRLAARFYGPDHVRDLETSDPQQVCREGLKALSARAVADLRSALETASSAPAAGHSRQFFDYVKRLVIQGYYTSRQGLRELDYKGNSFYSEPPGCTAAQ